MAEPLYKKLYSVSSSLHACDQTVLANPELCSIYWLENKFGMQNMIAQEYLNGRELRTEYFGQ